MMEEGEERMVDDGRGGGGMVNDERGEGGNGG